MSRVPPVNAPNAFPITRWSVVGRAGDADPSVKKSALGDLLRAYLPALKAHLVSRKRISPDKADDLLQGFCSDQVLERDLLPKAEKDRGKFRTFLLTALNRYAINRIQYENAAKRSAGASADNYDVAEQAGDSDADPSRAFDLAWARRVLDQAVERLRAECTANARADIWGVFEARIVLPSRHGVEPTAHDVLAAQLKLRSPAESANLLIAAKRAFARHLSSVVGVYEPSESVEAEVAELKAVLAGGRR